MRRRKSCPFTIFIPYFKFQFDFLYLFAYNFYKIFQVNVEMLKIRFPKCLIKVKLFSLHCINTKKIIWIGNMVLENA